MAHYTTFMIARHWRCWAASAEAADAYQRILEERILPALKDIDGFEGGYVLRYDGPDGVEFIELNFFNSIEAIQRFAGMEPTVPLVESEARALITKWDPVAKHYDVAIATHSR